MAEVTERDREAARAWLGSDDPVALDGLARRFAAHVAEERAAREKAEQDLRQARARIKKWEDHEVQKASCCDDNEQRAIKAEQERDEARRIVGLQQAALDVWKAAHPHEAVPKPHRESLCLEPTLRSDVVRLRKDLDRKDHEYAEQKARAEAAEARLRAVESASKPEPGADR